LIACTRTPGSQSFNAPISTPPLHSVRPALKRVQCMECVPTGEPFVAKIAKKKRKKRSLILSFKEAIAPAVSRCTPVWMIQHGDKVGGSSRRPISASVRGLNPSRCDPVKSARDRCRCVEIEGYFLDLRRQRPTDARSNLAIHIGDEERPIRRCWRNRRDGTSYRFDADKFRFEFVAGRASRPKRDAIGTGVDCVCGGNEIAARVADECGRRT